MNRRNGERVLAGKLGYNFRDGDYHLVLTYRGDPPPAAEAMKKNAAYVKKLKKLYNAAGAELKYVTVPGYGSKTGRIHHHTVINRIPGVGIDEIMALWKHGKVLDGRLDTGGEYRANRWEIVRRERRIEELAAMAESHGASAYIQRQDGAPSAHRPEDAEVAIHSDPTGKYASKIADYEREISDIEEWLAPCARKFSEMCGRLPKKHMRDVLVAKYHSCKGWKDAAEAIAYSERQAQYLHGEAVAYLSDVYGSLEWRA
jgi:hypothetical protein